MVSSQINGMNDAGLIVGNSYDGSNYHAFAYDHGTYINLEPAGAVASFASFVDDNGDIGGDYVDQNGLDHALSWRPSSIVPSMVALSALTDTGVTDLNAGHVVTISLSLNENLFVTGTPELQLSDGALASFTGGSGSQTLKFTYTVGAGDSATDLQVTSLNLNGGTIKDASGQALSGTIQGDLALQIDTNSPLVTISNLGGLTNHAAQTISGNVDVGDANSTVFVFDGSTQLGSTLVAADGSWSLPVTLNQDGTHSITASDTDGAGNVGSARPVTFMLDTVGPTITISQSLTHDTGSSSTDLITNDGHVVVSGTVSDLNGVASVEVYDGITDLGPATITNEKWSFPYLLPEGTHHLNAIATDDAGNPTQTSTLPQITVDLTKPQPVLSDITKDATDKFSTLTGTTEANSSVSVFDGSTLIGTGKADNFGHWMLQTNLTGNAIHSLTETSTDVAGNIGTSSGVTLYAASANNTLKGGAGNDFLIAGPKDTLIGGAGNDNFVFNPSFGKDVVSDFDVNHDSLLLSASLFSHATAAQVLSQTHDSSAGAVITVDSADTITLTGVTLAQLTAHQSDFHFF
jgi:hypothetical protein